MSQTTEDIADKAAAREGAEQLALAGGALATFARLLGPETERLAEGEELALLIEILDELGDSAAAELLTQVDDSEVSDPEDLRLTWTALFVRCIIPPYETSYMTGNVVGHTSELADISGFYGAFGFGPNSDRPDHLIAEIEFTSFLAFREADAVASGEAEGAEICRNALDAFLRDHLGCWLNEFTERLEREDHVNPYIPIIKSLASYVASLCVTRGVDPYKPVTLGSPVIPGVNIDSDDLPAGCHGCLANDSDGTDLPIN